MIRERHPRHTVTGNDGQSGPPTGRPFHKKFKTRDGAAGSRPPARPQQVANTGNKKRCSASDQFLLRSSQNEPAKAVMLFAYYQFEKIAAVQITLCFGNTVTRQYHVVIASLLE